MISSACQLPLFCRYDLSVEFEWRRSLAAKAWGLSSPLVAGETRLQEIFAGAEIYPLCFLDERPLLGVDPDGEAERCNAAKNYSAHYPISGDEGLWHMNPGIRESFPEGELFRGKLVLSETAVDEAEAQNRLEKRLQRVREVIDMQTKAIRGFHKSLEEELEGRLRAELKARCTVH